MCPHVTTVGSFHQGVGVKGRQRDGGSRGQWMRQVHVTHRLYNSYLSNKSFLSFRLSCAAAFACVCACVHISVRMRALADLPCEQWHLYALLIADQWALWEVWDALKSPTRHILVCQHIHEH